jgi:hypothetical protein
VWHSRRREQRRRSGRSAPARLALIAVGVYIAAMGVVTVVARSGVREALVSRGITPDTVVVDPILANPIRRRVIYLWQGSYHLATYRLLPTRDLSGPWFEIPLNAGHPAVEAANQTPEGREYHTWTRLPYYVIESAADTTWVTVADARYTLNGRSSWAVARIPVASPRGTLEATGIRHQASGAGVRSRAPVTPLPILRF